MSKYPDFQAFAAPAKINLFLHIVGQRADGYHLLQSVFCLLDYADTVYLKPNHSGTVKRVNEVCGVAEADDLCVRAAKLLQQHTQCQYGVEILLEKNIPMGGGLGGGSSDAATILLALNRLWKLNLKREVLLRLGLQLGADVPFFIFGTNAWAEGIGEQLQAITLKESYYVVLTPNVHVSTAQIFANKQLTKDTNPKIMSGFSRVANSSAQTSTKNSEPSNTRPEFINDLEKVVCALYPEVASCLAWLKQYGDARMSGSGASVFLELPDLESANKICSLKPENIRGFVAKGLNQHPLVSYAD